MWIVDRILTWWRGQTLNTQVWTALYGEKVGEDEQGNIYYQSKKGDRRWVIFNGPSEPSAIPPGWHGWMHHRTDVSPAAETYAAKPWEQAHQANMTGTGRAYRPKGSILNQGARPHVTGDYDAWTPKS